MHVSFSFTRNRAQTDFQTHTHHFPSSNYCVQRLNSQEKTTPRLIFVCSRSLLPERHRLKSILSIKRDTTAMNARTFIIHVLPSNPLPAVTSIGINHFFCFLSRKTRFWLFWLIAFLKRYETKVKTVGKA